MKVSDLVALSSAENINVFSIFVMKQIWNEGRVFVMDKPRRQNALLWFSGADGIFMLKSGKRIDVSRGELVCIPEGSEYSVQFINCVSLPTTVLVEFRISDGEPISINEEICVLEKLHEGSSVISRLHELSTLYSKPVRQWLEIKGCLYTLFASLSRHEEKRNLGIRGFSVIEKGIRYLQSDDEQRLSLDEVAAMCYVTPAYFRRMFRKYAGTSPSQYRRKHRIEKAKELLENTDQSIDEISTILGFDSPSYFCRTFKQEIGIAPSAYRKSRM